MVGLIEKLKSQIEMWKVEKYTKRRTFLPEYDSRVVTHHQVPFYDYNRPLDSEYYKQHYQDGVYYSNNDKTPSPVSRSPSTTQYRSTLGKRMSVMIKKKSSNSSLPHPRCSETYNSNYR
ncbi:hypothetical protein [Absidia glauca]|uniref:Uncharacterized protein n=1 Tax=Absidia glauca TaxID=4829 RepID=A0A168RIQ3_ABSGL|nr:hypothetical protein [Absidia glauca]